MQIQVNKNLELIFNIRYNYRNLLMLQSPQRLILRPFPFSVSTLCRGELIQSHSFQYQVVTSDSHILSPAQISPLHARSVYSTACSTLSLLQASQTCHIVKTELLSHVCLQHYSKIRPFKISQVISLLSSKPSHGFPASL